MSRGRREGGEGRIIQYEGNPSLPPIPELNIAVYLLEAIAQHGDNTAMINALTNETRSFKSIVDEVPCVAGGLAAAGVQKGDAVLFVSHNHFDYGTLCLAVTYLGAAFVPVNGNLNAEELARVLRISEAKYAVVQECAANNLSEAQKLLPPGTLRGVWMLERQEGGAPSLAHLLKGTPVSPAQLGNEASRTPAIMFFSSGTTGLPKGVLLSHTALLAPHFATQHLLSLARQALGDDGPDITKLYSRNLLILPLHHIYGYYILMFLLRMGMVTVLLPRFTTKHFLSTIEKFKISACPVVPHLASYLAQSPSVSDYDLSSLVVVSSSSAPLSPKTVQALQEKRGLTMSNGYGMTEAVNIASNGGVFGYFPGAVGKILPYMQVKVIDVNTGELLREGQEGEVCVKGPTMMLGYINNPEDTTAAIDSHGWLHTGDLGHYDADDLLYLTDRMKELIKVKGYQVSPKELEEVIERLDGVLEVAVIGVPHTRTGEAPRAYVVLSQGATTTPKDIQRVVADRFSGVYKQLKGGVEVVDSLPRTSTGKVMKRVLKDQFMASKSKL